MRKLTNFTFEIGNVGQCYGREKRDLRSSIANFRLCIADFFHNFNIGHRTNFTYFKTFEMENVGQDHGVAKRDFTTISGKFFESVLLIVFIILAVRQHTKTSKQISHILNIRKRKYRSRSRNTIFAMTPFDGKYHNLKTTFFSFLIFR